jgi:hypothetical protein
MLLQLPSWQAQVLQVGVGLRTKVLKLPYGDQGLIIHKSTLEKLKVGRWTMNTQQRIPHPMPSS